MPLFVVLIVLVVLMALAFAPFGTRLTGESDEEY